ncbi:hypothetical protein MBAV_004768 [Candidatus Magnetobacterium bavaricum]|uniref:Uncharacterized protein n=1 Tax=Candidatus Magnetobacterium bavaricum TaxID=29290 RepID=A0A0F3GQT1_9BACT|nr:hypothetical protein MBAV_004768 [Candidatus Magnetobacterium bavaricum]
MTLVFRLSISVASGLSIISSLLKTKVSRSGTHQRFSIEASNFFKKCLEVIISKMIENTKQIDTEILKPFPNVKIVDSSSWDVSPELKEIFGGFGGDASDANCKVQFMYEYKSGSILMLEETRGNMPDQRYSKNTASLINKDKLLNFRSKKVELDCLSIRNFIVNISLFVV